MLIQRFEGDVQEFTAAHDRVHALIMSRGGAVPSAPTAEGALGGAVPSGELRHHCATDTDSFHIGVWESEHHALRRWSGEEFRDTLTSVGFPSPDQAEMTVLHPACDRAAAVAGTVHRRVVALCCRPQRSRRPQVASLPRCQRFGRRPGGRK